ncbi:hypothetical protein O181_080907 [Austropuccinia psidii MF-1]|uniref:Uncharacterized protein n=1 Tax=Austropuccinia psidii MF-1 TaxID=1389203 RepID=A0A9Q3FMI3_9BASI|nr:hypothetical protein [Austropuccinia psidii MF-1]
MFHLSEILVTQKISHKSGKEEEKNILHQMTGKGVCIRKGLPKVPFRIKVNQVQQKNWTDAGNVPQMHLLLKYLSTWSMDNKNFTKEEEWEESGPMSHKVLLNLITFQQLLKDMKSWDRYFILLEERST